MRDADNKGELMEIATGFETPNSFVACTTDQSCTFLMHLVNLCGCLAVITPFQRGERRWDGNCNLDSG